VGVDAACDRGLQMVDGMEGSASDLAACDGREEALDGVEPGGRCRREMEHPARMIGEPFENLGLFVGGVVVDDGVDNFPAGTARSTALRRRMNSWWRCRLMQRPITVPSRRLSAANRVVLPLRL
jgi:hypothetical protein